MFYCPRCKEELDDIRLDVYGCLNCGHRWLIHPYKSEKHPERDG